MIMTVGDKRIDGLHDVLSYFNAESFLRSTGYNKGFGVIAFLFTAYFALLFTLPWRIKNKAYQDASDNADKPRV